MYFSDYIYAIKGFIAIFPSAIIPILMFSFFFYLGLKMFHAFILNGNWLVLSITGFICYAVALDYLNSQNMMMVIITGIPIFFIGREAYERLAK